VSPRAKRATIGVVSFRWVRFSGVSIRHSNISADRVPNNQAARERIAVDRSTAARESLQNADATA